MKLGFIITNVSFSGAQNVFNAVTAELGKRGHEVFILATNETADFTNENKRYYGLRTDVGGRFGRQIRRMTAIANIAKKQQIECLIAFGFNSNIKGILASKLSRVPVIICERMDPSALKNIVHKIERRALYHKADGVIVQTPTIKEFFSRKIQEKSFVIPNPVRTINPKCVAGEKRDAVIATVTRLDEAQKNLLHLIRCFTKFHKAHTEYHLVIIGDGPDKKLYEDEIARLGMDGNIVLTGKLENPLEKLKEYAMFTLVSYHEGMPNALIEAMSIGMPCVVEKFGGGAAEMLISDGKNGILIDNHDSEKLISAYEKLATDIDFREQLGKNAFEINEQLSLERIGSLWENAICSVVCKNSRRCEE